MGKTTDIFLGIFVSFSREMGVESLGLNRSFFSSSSSYNLVKLGHIPTVLV